jgi:zinc protease
MMGISEYGMRNGLKVLLAPNHSAPVVTFLVVYRVGSRNEAVGYTGSTHFLEHMMFKGTRRFDPAKGVGLDDLLKLVGADYNATTWFDRTTYYEVVPSQYLELCIKLEADRMRNLRLRQADRDAEMSVVRNELEQGENRPEEVMETQLYATAIREHPYHHPTIGWRSDVEGVPMERMAQFYDTYYWPNNATVIIVGDFEKEEALRLVHSHYGTIARSPKPLPEVYTTEPKQEGERRFEIHRGGDELSRLLVGFRVPACTHPDHYALNALSQVLGGSADRSSRLYAALVDSGLCSEVFTNHDEMRDPGLFKVQCTLNSGVELSKVESVLFDTIRLAATQPVSPAEMDDLRVAGRKGTILHREDQAHFAEELGEAESRADWRWMVSFDEHFDAVTADDIMRVAATYFDKDNRTVGLFIPKLDEGAGHETGEHDGEGEADDDADSAAGDSNGNGSRGKVRAQKKATAAERLKIVAPSRTNTKSSTAVPLSKAVVRQVLPNGLTVLTLPNRGTGSVAVRVQLNAGNYFEPAAAVGVADIVSRLLTKGSSKFDKTALANDLRKMGLMEGLTIRADQFRTNLGATVVTADLPLLLTICADVLRNPLLPEDEFAKTKLEWETKLRQGANDTTSIAHNRLSRELYPAGHPFAQPSFEDQLKVLAGMQLSELRTFHSRFYTPATTIVTVVGDVEPADAVALVSAAFGDWQGEKAQPVTIAASPLPAGPRSVRVFLPSKASLDIAIGHPLTLSRHSDDYYAAALANAALGEDTMSSRLGKVVREENGLTYGIYSGLGDVTFGGAPFTVALSVNPANTEAALALVDKVLRNYLKTGISRDELVREANGAAGAFAVSMRSSMGIARTLERFESLGMDMSAADEHPRKFLAVTKAQVDEAIRRHFHPDNLVTVLCGTLAK